MKKVLILTYYFPPINSVAGNRALSWAEHFSKYNLFPTIITRHWTGNEKVWNDFLGDNSNEEVIETHENYVVYKYPSDKLWLTKFLSNNLLKIKFISKIYFFLINYFGYLNSEIDANASFKNRLRMHLKENNYDLILATSPPLNIIRLASDISKEFKIPYFVDFRDLWNNDYLRNGYSVNGLEAILEKRQLFWIRKWLKNANMCFAVSQPIADLLGLVFIGQRIVINNGYDDVIFNNTKKDNRKYFCISLVGTFYVEQNMEILSEGLSKFLIDKDPELVKVRFVGLNANKLVEDIFIKFIPKAFTESFDRVSREQAAHYVTNSDVLLHAGWKGFRGIFTTKIFDYLASGNNILLAPGDNDVLSKLVLETNSGKVVEDAINVTKELENWYDQWEESGTISYFGNEKILFYSRSNQVKILVNAIKKEMHFSNEFDEMKSAPLKALILAYYFPPCNGAPAWRPYSWATNFPKHNIYSTVITRHWNGNESTWNDIIKDNTASPVYRKYNGYETYYLPTRKSILIKLFEKNYTLLYPLRKIVYLLLNSLGQLNTEVDAYLTFRDFLKHHLNNYKYDVVIITYPPPNIAKLGEIVKKYSSAKLVLDFRDLWNNLLLENDYQPGFKQKYFDFLFNIYHKKWLKFPDLITAVVAPFEDILKKLTSTPVKIIYNGYEQDLFNKIRKIESKKFRFTVVGTIYPKQDCNILIHGLNLFLSNKNPEDVIINFIGLSSIPEVERKITESIPSEYLNITHRVSKEQAIFYTFNSEVLFYPGWKGVRGIISTKAFDYIASGNKIILAPGDDDVLDNLILSTQSGKIVNDSHEFEVVLNEWFQEWKTNGFLKGDNDYSEVAHYSRENQAATLANLLHNLVVK